jgi:hypothetical protein
VRLGVSWGRSKVKRTGIHDVEGCRRATLSETLSSLTESFGEDVPSLIWIEYVTR